MAEKTMAVGSREHRRHQADGIDLCVEGAKDIIADAGVFSEDQIAALGRAFDCLGVAAKRAR